MTKLYLNQLMESYHIMDNVEQSEINLIHAYAGSGKTTYILDLINQSEENLFGENDNQFFYVCDTKLLKQQFKGQYETRKAKINGVEVEQLYKVGKHGEYIPMSCHIMTYYGWLYFMRNNKENIGRYSFKTFIFDECQNLAQNIINFPNDYDEEEIIDYLYLILEHDSTVIAMSATPSQFVGLMNDYDFTVNDLLQGHKDELRQYISNKVIKYHEKPSELLSHIPFCKAIVYFEGSIKQLKKEVENIRELGFNANYVVSDDNCGMEQLKLKERIVKNNDIPKEYDVIIFNKSMGTGINILDKNHEFNTFITYATSHEFLNDSNIYQARMRIRHDIEFEYHYTKVHDIKKADKDDMKQVEVINQYLDKDLSTSDIKDIIKELQWWNGKNPLSVNKAVLKLQELGYTVSIEVVRKVKHFMITK